MKKSFSWLIMLVALGIFQQCGNESEPAVPQNVRFTFNLPDASGGRVKSGDPVDLLLSLENGVGTSVFTSKRIALLHVGSDLMTEPVALLPGTYSITDFLLVDGSETVIFAAPKAGSRLAAAVEHPLPFSFEVSAEEVSNIDVEVVNVLEKSPEDFGYASFNINEVEVNTLQVAVFTLSEGDLALTTAHVLFDFEDNTLIDRDLVAGTNVLSFVGDPNLTYRLIIYKEGYASVVQDFVFSELKESLNGQPLKIVLSQFDMTAHVEDGTENHFQFSVGGPNGLNLHVEWGDGTSTDYTHDYELGEGIGHYYEVSGNYHVVVTGDVTSITEFKSVYGDGMLDAINLSALVNLTELRILLTHGPSTIDASHNEQLTYVDVAGVRELEHLILSESNAITGINIQGPNLLSTAAVDEIIKKIHDSPRRESGGHFMLDSSWMIFDGTMVGPPSTTGLIMLQDLANNDGWYVHPSPGS